MAVCGVSLHLGSSESRKTPEQKFIIHIGTLRACLHGGGGPQVGEVTRLAVVEK